MSDTKFYTCPYCFNEYEPKRRGAQIYCCNSCRSKAYHARKKKSQALVVKSKEESLTKNTLSPSKEKMSAIGIGNAAVGTLAADALKSFLTTESNKAATKGDLKVLSDKLINRYHRVNNRSARQDGALPYFDMNTGDIVYLKPILK